MAALGFLEGVASLQRGDTPPGVWLLLGDEAIMQQRLTRLLVEAVVPEHRDFNYQRLDCRGDTPAAACMMLCEELPLMAERRLVYLRDVHAMAEPALTRLAAYVAELPSSTVLWMTANNVAAAATRPAVAEEEGEGTASRGKAIKALAEAVKKHGVLVKGSLSDVELGQWVEGAFASRGLRAAAGVRQTFVTRVGGDLTALESELDKLACFVGERKSVAVADLEAVTIVTPSARIFELSNAVCARDASTALRVLSELLESDEEPLRILGYLASQFRGLIKLKSLQERGEGLARMAIMLDQKDWLIKKNLQMVGHVTSARLEASLDSLLRADQAIKTGKAGRMVLELLIIHLCR